ncbi:MULTISPECIES: hypothetical protein [Pacificibacter]|uniref:hypothetical protein n=1 Tax=Pacificibacter TaxID=1042323 RepID=UPI001C0821A8|nr:MULTISPECIES: hypothetical protein [Pacificibacter]MBU2936134.1 hypothetical protein [Pacificibacter marinus]MDO6615016.1 hypothetical protein [Pacificibacter sp. 1_MG-2023]
MTGYLLFKHAVARVFRNLDDALAISGLIWIATMAIVLVASTYAPAMPATVEGWEALTMNQILIALGANIAVIVASIWIAVEWHRFVLLGERPQTVIPPFRAALMLAYMGKSILLMVVLFAMMFVAMLVLMLVMALAGALQFLVMAFIICAGSALMYGFYRLSPMLPASALGTSLSIQEVWSKTEPYKAQIFQATILMILMTLLLQVPYAFLGSGVVGVVVSLVTGWIGLMVGVSLLSAIYELATSKAGR